MANITCGNCGKTHHSVSEVKGCYIAHDKLTHRRAKFGPLDGDPSADEGSAITFVHPDAGVDYDFAIGDGGIVGNDEARRISPHRMRTSEGEVLAFLGGSVAAQQEDERVYLNVPYGEKDQVKAAPFNARWDAKRKQWWVKSGTMQATSDQMPAGWKVPKDEKPKIVNEATSAKVGKGLYQNPDNGKIYLAYHSQYLDKMLAKELLTHLAPDVSGLTGDGLTKAKIPWSRGSSRDYLMLKTEWSVPIEKAAEFGKAFGFCMRCGRYLENDESVARGIGPKCHYMMMG